MNPLNDYGFELKKIPITQVKISPHRGKWYVEYRVKNPRFWLIDKWWWYDDSTHMNYSDANVRANVLIAYAYVEQIVIKKKEVFDVNPSNKFEV